MEAVTHDDDSVTNVARDGNVSQTVIETVAAAKGVDPLDMDPLYGVVDPDALDSMFQPTGGTPSTTTEVEFTMADCRVVVRDDGTVVATPSKRETQSAVVAPLEK